MLQKEFFKTQAYNAGPYPVISLTGNEKYEQNTVFRPGKYLIEVAPGLDSLVHDYIGTNRTYSGFVYLKKEEIITEKFIIRAYCGSDSNGSGSPGTNSYTGAFKVDTIDATTLSSLNRPNGIDVNHIFGAGGGNGYQYYRIALSFPGGTRTITSDMYMGGGGNCLGNGNNYGYRVLTDSSTGTTITTLSNGAGSCLHILPVNGVFGTDYLRAYHINGYASWAYGSVYGGGASPNTYLDPTGMSNVDYWSTRGGNSPYGTGCNNGVYGGNGTGIGAGKIGGCSCAYFNGTSWTNDGIYVDALSNGVPAESSYIRVTYLGPIE